MEIKFEDYKHMIQAKAAQVCLEVGIPFEEAYSEGLYLFAKYSKKWDPNKGRFSTYFSHCLKQLYWVYYKQFREPPISDKYTSKLKDRYFKHFVKTLEFYDAMDRQLSEDCKQVFAYLQTYIGRTPRLNSVQKYFRYFQKWERKRFLKAWNQLENWWLEFKLT